jgi:hypothetical protein
MKASKGKPWYECDEDELNDRIDLWESNDTTLAEFLGMSATEYDYFVVRGLDEAKQSRRWKKPIRVALRCKATYTQPDGYTILVGQVHHATSKSELLDYLVTNYWERTKTERQP